MKNHKITLILCFLLLFFDLKAQSNVTQIVQSYFEGKNSKSLLIGEALEAPYDLKQISSSATFLYEVLYQSNDESVVAVAITDGDYHVDVYTYLQKSKSWKIAAFREYKLPGIFYIMHEKYKEMDENMLQSYYMDNLPKDSGDVAGSTLEYGSLENFIYNVRNWQLTVASDAQLVEYFKKNTTSFELLLLAIKQDTISTTEAWKLTYYPERFRTDLHELLLQSVEKKKGDAKIYFTVGGLMRSYVGYFYCEDEADFPVMSPDGFMMLKSLGKGWYLYKVSE